MIKKIGYGAGLWAIMFLGISALIAYRVPILWQGIGSVGLSIVAAAILGFLFFKKQPSTVSSAIVLGVVWLIVGTILDLLVTVQFVRGNDTYVNGLKTFYGTWSLWVGYASVLVVLVILAKIIARPTGPTMTTPPSINRPNPPTAAGL